MLRSRDLVVAAGRGDVSTGEKRRQGGQSGGLFVARRLAVFFRGPAALVLLIGDPLLRGLKCSSGLWRNVRPVSQASALAGPPDRFPLGQSEGEIANGIDVPAF